MKKSRDFIFWVFVFASILFCCKCFQTVAGERELTGVIGGEVFTLVLPLWLIDNRLTAMRRTNNKLKHQLQHQRQTMNEQAELIDHLLSEKETTLSQRIVDVRNAAENPTR